MYEDWSVDSPNLYLNVLWTPSLLSHFVKQPIILQYNQSKTNAELIECVKYIMFIIHCLKVLLFRFFSALFTKALCFLIVVCTDTVAWSFLHLCMLWLNVWFYVHDWLELTLKYTRAELFHRCVENKLRSAAGIRGGGLCCTDIHEGWCTNSSLKHSLLSWTLDWHCHV